MLEIVSQSPHQTKKLGQIMAGLLKGREVICLEGDLGGGKTTFLQGLANGLGAKEEITSPTFILLRKYPLKNSKVSALYHIDCYRINQPEEILDLGLEDILQEPKAVVAIEWADKIKKVLPKNRLTIKFEFIDEKKRRLLIKPR